MAGELAQHSEAALVQSTEVNAAVVSGSSASLPGESERSGDRLPKAARRVERSNIKSHGGNAVGSQQKP